MIGEGIPVAVKKVVIDMTYDYQERRFYIIAYEGVPNRQQLKSAKRCYSFVRDEWRISVIQFNEGTNQEQARYWAANYVDSPNEWHMVRLND